MAIVLQTFVKSILINLIIWLNGLNVLNVFKLE